MTQRLALARATLHDPHLLLLDEPYNALDAEGLERVDRLLARLRASGVTLVIATHQPARAAAHCVRAVALRAGRIVYDGALAGLASGAAADEDG
jgi:ABC-type multidrug transport system ATPase subunit